MLARPRTLLLLSLLFAAACPLPVMAQEDDAATESDPRMEEAQSRFAEATALFDRGDYESALAEFQEIYALMEGHPRRSFVLFNIGLTQEELFRYDEALATYRRFLEEAPRPAPREDEVRGAIERLVPRLATLTITTNVPEAEVWVDERRVGTAPGSVSVTGGRHVIELRAQGYNPARTDLQVAARTEPSLNLELDRSFAGVSPAFFVTGAGLTVASLGVALGFAAAAIAEHGNLSSQLSDSEDQFEVTQARIAAMEQNALIADVMFGAAGVLGIATVVLAFVTDWGSEPPPEAASLRVTPFGGATAAGLTLEGSF